MFWKNGEPFQIIGGDLHYFRVLPEVPFCVVVYVWNYGMFSFVQIVYLVEKIEVDYCFCFCEFQITVILFELHKREIMFHFVSLVEKG